MHKEKDLYKNISLKHGPVAWAKQQHYKNGFDSFIDLFKNEKDSCNTSWIAVLSSQVTKASENFIADHSFSLE